jgi:flagellar biosynthesis protein FlhF
MQVKRFFAADMRTAMKLVRDELGADASIIGNRRVAGGVELTAALDYQVPAAPTRQPNPALEAELRKTQAKIATAQAELSTRTQVESKKDRQLFVDSLSASLEMDIPAAPKPVSNAVAAGVDQQALDAMRFELHGLRELIEVQLGSIAWGQMQNRRPQQANLWRRLQRMGLPAEISKPLLERVANIAEPRQAWRMLLAHLSHAIKTPAQEPMDEGGVIALVGPAGMGKTTTLAKLAARYVLKFGAQHIALVSLDSYRIGAQEQIKTLGRILNVSVTLVDPGQSLTQALAPLARKRVVLIDTAGLPS